MTMPKRDPKIIEQHDKAVAEFNAQSEPAAYICFLWPHLNRWQAVAAYEPHRALAQAARNLALEARQIGGEEPR
jgi:hypothetical protein